MGGGVEEAPFSVSVGAMRALLRKLDTMIGPQGCKLTKGVNDMWHLLKGDLEEISALLENLLEVDDPPVAAKCWMKEAHGLSYDILDYIDNLVPLEGLGCKSVVRKMSHVKISKRLKCQKHIEAPHVSKHVISKTAHIDVIRTPRRIKWYQDMVEKVSEFKIYAQEVLGQYERYQVHRYITSVARRFLTIGPMMPMPPPPCEKTCSGLVIDGRMSKFINLLANDGDQQLKVVSIHGSRCVGKTMLAKVFYNKIRRKFDCRAFIRVSKKPDIKKLLHDMLSQIKKKQPQARQDDSDELCLSVDNVRNYLHGKRYLIIIDDLWDTSSWDAINQVFPKGSQGSRIITTTQIEDVALACCCDNSDNIFEMKPLDADHSRKLFLDRLFGSEIDCPEEFKQVSSEIAELCGGLPLATISIASLLANQPSVSMDVFTRIHDSLVSCLPSKSTAERTRQVLNLSYNSLPHYLKTCLLYLSMHPEGSILFKHDLVWQWVAEGFIATREGKYPEEIAGVYFDELVDRRFIHPISLNYTNEVVSYTVHDIVHDLIAHKSAEENFVVVVDYNQKILALSHKVRRLSLQLGDAEHTKIPSNITKSQVRSLGFFGLSECMPCIEEFKIVRVLNLELSGRRDCEQAQAIDLTGLSELFHLRYLKIVCDVCIKLPSRMRGLQCMETLDVKDTARGTHVPWDIIYLQRLLHLSLPLHTNLLDWYVYLDKRFRMLNHLQDLYISTPPGSNPYQLNCSMKALGCLITTNDSLKTLKVVAHGSSGRYGDVSRITISWYWYPIGVVLPPHLQRFECFPHSGFIFESIPLKGKLGNLCILKITVSEVLLGYNVDALRRLPALTDLSLYVETAPKMKIIFGKAGFSVLKYFKLRFKSGIAWLKFEADAMPNLWKLRLVFNSIPGMDQRLPLYLERHEMMKPYRHGTALISIEHMPRIRAISAKFGGAATDLQYVSRIGVVSNHLSNPIMDMQLVDSGSHGDKRIASRSSEPTSHLHVPGKGGGGEDSWMSNIISVLGRDLVMYCLVRLSRSDYGSIASLNHDFNSMVRNGDIYRMRRKKGLEEHWIYLHSDVQGWDAYDLHRRRWMQVPEMPPDSFVCDSLTAGTELLVFGEAEVIVRYSILTDSWTWEADGMNQNNRRLFGSASVGGMAYVAGGSYPSQKRILRSAEMYDSETHAWTQLPSMNKARYNCSGAFMDGKFYVIGGIGIPVNYVSSLTCGEEYDLERRSWRVIDNMCEGLNINTSCAPPIVAVVKNVLYAADYTENDLKQYRKAESRWITLGNLPVRSSGNGSDIALRGCGDRLIVLGPPIKFTGERLAVELHSWIPDELPPVWTFVATRPRCRKFARKLEIKCAVMGC